MVDLFQPMFLYMAYQAVHAGNGNDPIQAPQEYIDRFPYIANEKRRKFAGMVIKLTWTHAIKIILWLIDVFY